jgi:hypothetical protein
VHRRAVNKSGGDVAAAALQKSPNAAVNMVRIIAPIHITSSLLRGEQRRQNAWHVKYWEIIVENLRNAGWNCGSMATTDGKGRPIWVVAAERSDAGRFIVHADQELPAFLELESAIQTDRHNHECDCPEPDEELGSNR